MKKPVRIALVIFLLIIPVFFSGCWDRVEINELAIIRAIAIDYIPDEGEYLITLVVIRPDEAVSGTEGGGGGASPTRFFSGKGFTLDMAIQQAGYSLSRRIFLTHNQLILVGEEAARLGLFHITDFIMRDNQLRLTNAILVVPGLAQEAIRIQERLENSVIEEILGIIEQAQHSGETSPQETYQIMRQLATPGICPHTAVLRVEPPLESKMPELQKEQQGNGQKGGGTGGREDEKSGELPSPETVLVMDGLAVFCGEHLAGYLNIPETRGFMFLANLNPRSTLTVSDPVHPEEKVSLQITRSRTKIIPRVNDGRISFRVEVEEEGNLLSQTSRVDLTTPEMMKKLASAKAGLIKADMEKALHRLQELQSDAVGFGEQLNRRYPDLFSAVEDWPRVFSEVSVEIHVTAHIRRTGQFSHPIRNTR